MRIKSLLILLFLVLNISAFAGESHSFSENKEVRIFEKGKKNKNGRYKKRKHRLKKLLMGKRYCDCPKH